MGMGAWLEPLIARTEAPFLAAFLIGLLASIGPCPLATNAAALGYTARHLANRRAVLASALLYTLGRAAAYGLVGLLVLAAGVQVGKLARGLQDMAEVALGPLLILTALVLLDVLRLAPFALPSASASFQERAARLPGLGGFALGFLFALAFCPYSAALFFGVLMPLALGASSGQALPLAFGVGTAMPVLLLGVPLTLGLRQAASGLNLLGRAEPIARKFAGWVFLATGAYLIWLFLEATLI